MRLLKKKTAFLQFANAGMAHLAILALTYLVKTRLMKTTSLRCISAAFTCATVFFT